MSGEGSVGVGLLLTTLAGGATLLGGLVVCSERLLRVAGKESFLAAAMALAGGVMVYVSFVDIFPTSIQHFEKAGYGKGDANLLTTLALFAGVLVVVLLDMIVHRISPDLDHDHVDTGHVPLSATDPDEEDSCASLDPFPDGSQKDTLPAHDPHLHRAGLLTALAITLHNFPEGMATFAASLDSPKFGVILALAIAIHNIPEGLAVAVPLYFSTNSKVQALTYCLISAVAEPIAALVTWGVLGTYVSDALFGWLFGGVGGIMAHVALAELLPAARRHDPKGNVATWWMVVGMAVMAASLAGFAYLE
eukprot:comp24401_c0_seq1/m.46669 comp24401_c0_seq1/g.46669  ORF comp24401_c0_seq1/g.46669 comp24401_c0_seq1/m.46669 type:complete len:306 (-) comp24401_c0_seq1:767-1684(-)